MFPIDIYGVFLIFLSLLFIGLSIYKGLGLRKEAGETEAFKSFQRRFLAIYLVMMAADWLQGPYVYRLYSYYGFTRHENGVLFIVGFGSSMVFGTWAGPMADRYGRKLNCLLYGVTYFLSCVTKFFPNFAILMIGRLLGGFATSILWSAFESWMVSEHLSRGFDPSLVGGTFSYMIALNGIVAILSGLMAQWSVDYFDHPVAPFGLSMAFLVLGTALVKTMWSENYGDRNTKVLKQMQESIQVVKEDKGVFYVGLQQACFEGAMYTFVFMWTPALEVNENIPHGKIFACFMVACSLGSILYSFIEKSVELSVFMRNVFLVAAISMVVPVFQMTNLFMMSSFIVYEICVGLFWPGIGTLRSRYLPESHRATIINLFRIPLNLIVCVVLFLQGRMSVYSVFIICVVFNCISWYAAHSLKKYPPKITLNLDSSIPSDNETTVVQ